MPSPGKLDADGEPQMQVGAELLKRSKWRGGKFDELCVDASKPSRAARALRACIAGLSSRSCTPMSLLCLTPLFCPQVAPELKAYYDHLLAKYIPQGVLRW